MNVFKVVIVCSFVMGVQASLKYEYEKEFNLSREECKERNEKGEMNIAKVVGKNRGGDAGFLTAAVAYFAHTQLDVSPTIYVPALGLSCLAFAASQNSLNDQEKSSINNNTSLYRSHFVMGFLRGGLITTSLLMASGVNSFDSVWSPRIVRTTLACVVAQRVVEAFHKQVPAFYYY